jgi:hypothetical protein
VTDEQGPLEAVLVSFDEGDDAGEHGGFAGVPGRVGAKQSEEIRASGHR